MSVYLIEYRDGAKVMSPVTTREKYLQLRGLAVHKDRVERIRSLTPRPLPRGEGAKENEEQIQALKKRLIQFNYSCIPTPAFCPSAKAPITGEGKSPQGEGIGAVGLLKGCKQMSTSVGIDVDHIPPEEMEATKERILAKKDEIGLLMLERSVRCEGYHIVCKRVENLSQEDNIKHIAEILEVEPDMGAKDITRVFFATTSSSEDLIYLDDELFKNEACEEEVKSEKLKVNSEQIKVNSEKPTVKSETVAYLGIPYDDIIGKYWELFYGGKTPVKSNRDTLTYELANVMKHICGFDRQLLAEVIPCYDGFPEEEKMKCIDSALSGKRTQMPKRLRDVLETLRRQMLVKGDESKTLDFDDAMAQDELFHYNRIPKGVMVQGIKDSIDAAGHTLVMPVLVAVCPAIGARATGVKLYVHGKPNTLNLISYVVGDFGSGKGQMDDVIYAWLSEDRVMAKIYNQQWKEWRDKYKVSRNKKELPAEPKLPKVWLPLNNTTANLAESLANVEGRHAFSFTPEADVVSQKWKSSVSDFSTMLRQAYDASSYDREARSVDAVNVHIERLLWNVVMCGTPDALYRVVDNYTDGFQSRIAVARTPDNTYQPLDDNPAILSDLQREKIVQVSHLLPLMNGTIELPKLEERGRRWLEEIRLESMKNDDRTMARQRFRVCVTAQRMTCCLMLAAVCARLIKKYGLNGAETRLKQEPDLWIKMTKSMQSADFMEMFDIIADSLIENALYFFRERIEAAFNASSYSGSTPQAGSRTRKGKNDSIYSRLEMEFTLEDAMMQSIAIKGAGVTHNAVRQMLKNWEKQGLVVLNEKGDYSKDIT